MDGWWKLIEVRPSVELDCGTATSPPTATMTRPRSRSRRCSLGREFMAEEPVKPNGRKGKPQPATLSMFEWAMTEEQEREREKEPVGAGR